MTQLLEFPGLGLSFEVSRAAFNLFGLQIYWYGIIIGLAFAAAVLYYIKRAPEFDIDGERMLDVLMVTIICGIVGARLYYVVFRWELYADAPLSIFNLREGGLAIYGGVILGIIGARFEIGRAHV